MSTLVLAFQPNILGVLSQFSQFEATLQKYIATATETSAGIIGDGTIAQMEANFNNPTGQLAGSIEVRMQDAYHAFIGSPLPYSWRRDRGFSGMTDSLGRYYPNDPGIYYAEVTINDTDVLRNVAQKYIDAIYGAWNELVGSLPGGTSVSVGMVA